MKMKFLVYLFFVFMVQSSFGQGEILALWDDIIPNSKATDEKEIIENNDIIRISKVQNPTLQVFLPPKRTATGRAVIVCPGGGYGMLAYDWEGADIAKWFNTKGITAFVLKYRLPNSNSILVRHEAPLQDAQRAIRLIRYHAHKWNINKNDVGVIGFSAGGHLASTLGIQFDKKTLIDEDEIDKISARPDFMMLIYPVVSMKMSVTHSGSRENLLGENPAKALIKEFSNELQVKKNTPRTFIMHSADDKVVPVENSLNLYKALKDASIDAEIHIYSKGGHGYSLAIGEPHLETWTNRLADWLNTF